MYFLSPLFIDESMSLTRSLVIWRYPFQGQAVKIHDGRINVFRCAWLLDISPTPHLSHATPQGQETGQSTKCGPPISTLFRRRSVLKQRFATMRPGLRPYRRINGRARGHVKHNASEVEGLTWIINGPWTGNLQLSSEQAPACIPATYHQCYMHEAWWSNGRLKTGTSTEPHSYPCKGQTRALNLRVPTCLELYSRRWDVWGSIRAASLGLWLLAEV